jgi:hypothetical protein
MLKCGKMILFPRLRNIGVELVDVEKKVGKKVIGCVENRLKGGAIYLKVVRFISRMCEIEKSI